jgi:hypothetical protein
MTVDGRQMSAHRASYIAFRGQIPKGNGYHGTCVLHTCDNTLCVNPDHLRLGTHAENMADMREKGRTGVRDYNIGSKHGMSKLTETDVRNIRALAAEGHRGCDLARRFNISPQVISEVVARKRWRHI